jgi:hypothetical protein
MSSLRSGPGIVYQSHPLGPCEIIVRPVSRQVNAKGLVWQLRTAAKGSGARVGAGGGEPELKLEVSEPQSTVSFLLNANRLAIAHFGDLTSFFPC